MVVVDTKLDSLNQVVIEFDDPKQEIAQVNFARLLHRYTRSFVQSDPQEALHYIYLVCLNADLPAPLGQDQIDLCHNYVRELVMDTRKYAELLGDVRNDGTKIVRFVAVFLSFEVWV